MIWVIVVIDIVIEAKSFLLLADNPFGLIGIRRFVCGANLPLLQHLDKGRTAQERLRVDLLSDVVYAVLHLVLFYLMRLQLRLSVNNQMDP